MESVQAHPSEELPVSAFCNAYNCFNSLPPFEANEDLAKACLLRKGLGFILGVRTTDESHSNLSTLMKNKKSFAQEGQRPDASKDGTI